MSDNYLTIKDINFDNKVTLVRVDFNVPIKDGKVMDDNRIIQTLPTLNYLLSHNAKLVLFSHLGRVQTAEDLAKNTLKPVAEKLQSYLPKFNIKFIPFTQGKELEDAINQMSNNDIILVENTRFEDLNGKKESKNDSALGKYWANLGEIFVNDAFGTAHRAHASNVGIASNISISCLGFLVEKEVSMLSKVLDNPKRPYIAILGGSKISDKIAILNSLLEIADKVIVGGGMAYTFLKSEGYKIGNSLVEDDKITLAKSLLYKYKSKLVLPIDHVVADSFSDTKGMSTPDINIPDGKMALDIGDKSIELFKNTLKGANTICWNGPLGVFEFKNFQKGTLEICKAIAENTNAFTLIGGGDSAAAAIKFNYADKFSHVSTGGGASLEFLEGKVLPGISCIQKK